MRVKILKYILFSLVVSVGVLFIPYHLAFAKKIIPGVWVGSTNLGGKTLPVAKDILSSYFEKISRETIQDITLSNWGVTLNSKETALSAYHVGRSGNIVIDTKNKIRAYKTGFKVSPMFSIDNNIFETQLEEHFKILEEGFREASLNISEGQVVFKPGQKGKAVDVESFKRCLFEEMEKLETTSFNCEVSFIEKEPQYTQKDFENVKKEVSSLSIIEINLHWPGGAQTIKGADLLNLLEIEPQGLFVSLEKVNQYTASLALKVNLEPINAFFEEKESGTLAIFTPSREGVKIKEDPLTENLVELLDEILKTPPTTRQNLFELEVETEIIAPKISQIENEYGIKTLLGEGQSNYHGSAAGRIYNINLSSEKLNGKLIKPGATISFNNLLGEVSSDTGYKSSYVIINNQTILGAGGGVCQASTTMFRAALNAGLPILERTSHLYRVHYYEPPLGLDATVMAPYTDFVFQNDTPAYILIQTQVDTATENVTYRIFGTSDGRQTTVTTPLITNRTGYPETIYKDDPTLEKGETVQVEWAAGGATATVKRKVTKQGETLQDDTFISHYVPWPAVFLVGTKE